MSQYRKPKFAASHDANHFIVRDFLRFACGGYECVSVGTHTVHLANLRGVRIGAIDTGALGGPWLDWVCFADAAVILVEVKTLDAHRKDGHSLTDNEAWTFENLPLHKRVVCTDEQVAEMYAELCG
jgi:hypothetical protein